MAVSKQEWARVCELVRKAQKDRFGEGALYKVADELDKTFRTWSSEQSPNNENHKLGLKDTLNALDLTGNFYDFFSFLLDRYDYHIAPNPGATLSTSDIHKLLTRSAKEAGDIANAVLRGSDPDSPGGSSFTEEEQADILKEVDDLLQVLYSIKSQVQEPETDE